VRMLLTSNGLTNDTIRACVEVLLGKPIEQSKLVLVIDAFLPFGGDKTHFLGRIDEIRREGWAEFDVLSLLATPRAVAEERLRAAEAIYCYGGTNHWLAYAWTSTGLAPVLAELLEQKVYIGMSAGSMIFSTFHAASVQALDDQDEVAMLGLDQVGPALPLFGWWLIPHRGAEYVAHQSDEWMAERAQRLGAPVWFIDDDTALLVRDPAIEPEVVSAGRWLQLTGGPGQ